MLLLQVIVVQSEMCHFSGKNCSVSESAGPNVQLTTRLMVIMSLSL